MDSQPGNLEISPIPRETGQAGTPSENPSQPNPSNPKHLPTVKCKAPATVFPRFLKSRIPRATLPNQQQFTPTPAKRKSMKTSAFCHMLTKFSSILAAPNVRPVGHVIPREACCHENHCVLPYANTVFTKSLRFRQEQPGRKSRNFAYLQGNRPCRDPIRESKPAKPKQPKAPPDSKM